MLRKLMGAAVMCAVVLGAPLASSGTKECEDAKVEVSKAQKEVADAERECATKSNSYGQCVAQKGAAACKPEQAAMQKAKKRLKDARDALRFALSKKKQACG